MARSASLGIPAGRESGWFERAACIVRRMIGVPDYDVYLTHMREHHPDLEPLSRDDFVRQRMESRYQKAGTRCC
jgi:uncharacterized short protein YbdD (DUF466 family)